MTDSPLAEVPSPPGDQPARPRRDDEGEVAGGAWRVALLAAAVVALGVFAGQGWLMIVGALTVMIFLHELGHYLTAKWSGMKVTQFFIGIGPKLWSFRRGETEYGLKLVPIAAYVRIIGMNNLDDTPPEDEHRTYRQQSFPKRMLVITAGSGMHFLQAFVLFVALFAVVGVPGDSLLAQQLGGRAPLWSVTEVVEGEAAERGGIVAGDRILSIDGEPVDERGDVGTLITDRAGQRVEVVVDRAGERVSLPLTVGRHPEDRDRGFLGVSMRTEDLSGLPTVTTDPLHAVTEAGRTTGDWMWQTTRAIGSFITGGVGNFASQVVDGGARSGDGQGPVVSGSGEPSERPAEENGDRLVSIYGVARIGADAGQNDLGQFLLLLALVNISIGILNLVPLLPLDGGHAAIAVYERIRSIGGRRHMTDVSRLLPVTYAVVLLLGLVMVSTVYLDIVDPIGLR